MATADRDVEMGNYNYSSSPELSSLPSDSPSEPGSPSRHDQRRTSLGRRTDEIIVDASSASRFGLMQQQTQQSSLQSFPLDGVRLTKEGVPRKKPGRKPGTVVKKASDGTATSLSTTTAAGSGVEAAKPRRARKPKDPNAPPPQRKKRAQPTSAPAADAAASGLSRPTSANLHFEPKVELTSMRMDIDPRPSSAVGSTGGLSSTHQPPRQPPLTIMDNIPKRESLPSSMKSILNADDSPPRPPPAVPASTTPVRSVGQNYDPVRSSNYDPVRETMLSRDPYGTGPLGSPRAPTQMTNRASASPSIASLVDPAPVAVTRSPIANSSVSHQVSPPPMSVAAATTASTNAQLPGYRDNISSLPPSPSPSPAIRNAPSSSSTSSRPQTNNTTKPSAATSPKAATMTKTTSSSIPPLAVTSKSSSQAKSASSAGAKSSAAKSETNGDAKSRSRPPPPPPVPASAKATTSKTTSTKTAAQKSSAAKAAAAADASSSASSEAPAASKSSGPITTTFRDVAMTGASTSAPPAASNAPHIKKFSSILQQERGGKQNKTAASATSSPKLSGAKDDGSPALAALDSSPLPSGGEPERSILDFGKALPGEHNESPSIVLHIPLIKGENNKYVNFMRMAEERYGWDALHPRLAAHRDRKLRIAAASAALEKNGSGRESGDEMTDDMQSGDEGSNEENAAAGDNGTNGVNASGPDDAPAKPARKKRIFKEDEYDKDDDFVDDSELLWEEQAAASRDGFFVYSGPLVPEEEKPAEGTTPPAKRGRGSRGGRGGTSRSATSRAATGRASGGAGSRGGTTTRKPRATKQEKEQRQREKAEHDKASSKANGLSLPGTNPSFSAGMAIDV